MKRDFTIRTLVGVLIALLLAGPLLPRWAMFLITVSLCYGTVVLGMMLLMRTGVVSFGHGLYYCLGAYAAGTLDVLFGVSDIAVMLLAAVAVTGVVSALLGLLLRKYRDIFFAMLSLAFSMILYGLLVKTSALGSSDGFNVAAKTLFGIRIAGTEFEVKADLVLLAMGFVHPVHEGMIKSLGITLDPRGNVKADTTDYRSSIDKVFAAGDMRRGQSLVVWAIREGRQAAHSVDKFLMGTTTLPR